MSTDDKISKIDKFNGTNIGFWKMQMEDYLYQKDLYQPLTEKPKDMVEAEWKVLDRKALGAIRLTLSKSVAFNIKHEQTTTSLMKALSSMYEQPSAANKVHLIKKLFNMKMSESGKFGEYLNEFNEVTDQLTTVGIKFDSENDSEVRALLILGQLPESWNGTVTAISSSAGKSKLKFDDVVSMILTEEIRRQSNGASTSGAALNMNSRGRNPNRGQWRGRSKSRNGRERSQNHKSSNKSKSIECWNCGQIGHYRTQCKVPPKENEKKIEANVVAEEAGDALICSMEKRADFWVIDSGASFHATSNRHSFINYVSGNFGEVYLRDDHPCSVVGIGEVQINLNGSVWKLKDVRHIPELRKNLISVKQLSREGCDAHFSDDCWKITKGSMIIARGKDAGSLYTTMNACVTVAVADSKKNTNLWHQRLGHMSQKGLKYMHSKGKLPMLKFIDIDFCESCIFGKHKRVSFNTSGRTPKQVKLELVHTDVWGPAAVSSIGGKSYFVTFIDDHSRKVWVYFLRHKSEVFEVFKKWKAMVENETGLRIKKLRSDNGGEYEDMAFKKCCYCNGIKLERTLPRTPQQNGVAERMNRTLTEKARSMRIHAGLPTHFWAEAVNTAAYLVNHGPSVPLEYRIPEEV